MYAGITWYKLSSDIHIPSKTKTGQVSERNDKKGIFNCIKDQIAWPNYSHATSTNKNNWFSHNFLHILQVYHVQRAFFSPYCYYQHYSFIVIYFHVLLAKLLTVLIFYVSYITNLKFAYTIKKYLLMFLYAELKLLYLINKPYRLLLPYKMCNWHLYGIPLILSRCQSRKNLLQFISI